MVAKELNNTLTPAEGHTLGDAEGADAPGPKNREPPSRWTLVLFPVKPIYPRHICKERRTINQSRLDC